MPNDRDFSDIELRKKKMPLIYDIDEWVEQVEKSRNQNKFEIHRMKNKFRNFNQMLEQINMKVSKNVENERFNWLNLQ